MTSDPLDVRRDDTVRDAIRFAALVAVLGIAFLIVAALWTSTCGDAAVDTVACGTPERTLLGLGAPAILFIGGVGAFVRTYRNWRADGTWVPWQGAGWFLLSLMLVVLTMSLAPLMGPIS